MTVPDASPQAPADPIIFDLDGTLVDTLPLIYHAFNVALEPVLGRLLDEAEIRARFGPPDHEIIRSLVSDVEFEEAVRRYLSVYEQEHDRYVAAFAGVPEMLQRARQSGARIGVVTGKSRQTALVTLEKTGLMPLVDVLYAGDDVQRPKPDPEAVVAALRDLGCQDNQAGVMVGDSAADILAGRAAGLQTIAVTWGSPDHDDLMASCPGRTCYTMAELSGALGLN